MLHAQLAHVAERHRRGVQNGRPPRFGDPQKHGSGTILLSRRHATSHRTSLRASRAPCLTTLGAVCAASLTTLHPGCLGFSFFWQR